MASDGFRNFGGTKWTLRLRRRWCALSFYYINSPLPLLKIFPDLPFIFVHIFQVFLELIREFNMESLPRWTYFWRSITALRPMTYKKWVITSIIRICIVNVYGNKTPSWSPKETSVNRNALYRLYWINIVIKPRLFVKYVNSLFLNRYILYYRFNKITGSLVY